MDTKIKNIPAFRAPQKIKYLRKALQHLYRNCMLKIAKL